MAITGSEPAAHASLNAKGDKPIKNFCQVKTPSDYIGTLEDNVRFDLGAFCYGA